MNRRHFMALTSALPVAGFLRAQPATASTSADRLFVTDTRLSKPRILPPAKKIVALSGDVTRPWFADIGPYLNTAGQSLSGETLGDALFCLSVLAAGNGWRLSEVRESATNASVSVHNFNQETAYRWVLTRRDMGQIGRTN